MLFRSEDRSYSLLSHWDMEKHREFHIKAKVSQNLDRDVYKRQNINYRGISDIQIVDIESIIELMKDEYYTVSGKKLLFGNVYVQEQYLSLIHI